MLVENQSLWPQSFPYLLQSLLAFWRHGLHQLNGSYRSVFEVHCFMECVACSYVELWIFCFVMCYCLSVVCKMNDEEPYIEHSDLIQACSS